MRLALLLALLAPGGVAQARIELGDQPAIGGATRLDQLRRRLTDLKAQDTERARRAQNEVTWRARLASLSERADTLTSLRATRIRDTAPDEAARRWAAVDAPPLPEPPDAGVGDTGAPRRPESLLPVIEVVDDGGYQEGYLAPGIHPAELKALDDLITTIDLAQHRYETLLHHLWEEQTQLARAEAETRSLIEQLEVEAAKVPSPSTRAVSLEQIEQLAVEAHQASIERSLARQRARQGAEAPEEAPPVPPAPIGSPPQQLQPAAAFEASLKRTADMRADQARLLRELGTLQPQIVTALRQAREAVDAAHQAEVEAADRAFKLREAALTSALARLRITDKDQAAARAALETTRAQQAERIDAIRQQLDALRLTEPSASAGGTDDDPLSELRVHRIERAALTEELVFLRAEHDRDALRLAVATHLNPVIQGKPPAPALVADFQGQLDARATRQHKQDLAVRCDGWRRGRSSAQKAATVDASQVDRKERALQAFATLADLCMRQEWVLDAQERLARVARFHLERQALESRNLWWYAWRGVLSLLFALLLTLVTRWIGRVTHRLARPAAAAPEPATASRTKATEPAQLTWTARISRVRGTAALIVYLTMAGSLWFFSSALVVEHLWAHPVEWSTWLGWITFPLMTVGGNPVSLWSIVKILMWIVGGLWLARLFQGFLSEGLMEHFAVQRGVRDVVGTLARYLVILLGIIFGLSSAGIPLTALAAVFGVLGIGIGFGLQNIASNFISGFIILVERPFRRGDYIQVGDMVGEVKEIRARATTIETRDAVTVVVPNSEFVTGKVINWTLGHNERLRTHVSVGVAYGSDLQLVTRILLDVGRAHADVLGWPGPRVEMIGFNDSSIDFVLHVWTRRLRTLPGLRSDLYLGIERRFREAKVEIPFPIRTLVMAKDPPPPAEQAPITPDDGAPTENE